MAVAESILAMGIHRLPSPEKSVAETSPRPPAYERPYFYNVSNSRSRAFYATRGLSVAEDAFELHTPQQPLIMQCRYCLRYALGYCVKNGGRQPQWREPLSLQLSDGRRFPLVFDCRHCQMNVYAESR
jgi:putative protease